MYDFHNKEKMVFCLHVLKLHGLAIPYGVRDHVNIGSGDGLASSDPKEKASVKFVNAMIFIQDVHFVCNKSAIFFKHQCDNLGPDSI